MTPPAILLALPPDVAALVRAACLQAARMRGTTAEAQALRDVAERLRVMGNGKVKGTHDG
jgi:hypothetical protein